MKKMSCFICAMSLSFPIVLLDQKNANAWTDFCNSTGDRITVAFGYHENGDWQSSGWHTLRDNSCNRFWPHELRGENFYYFALDRNGNDITPKVGQRGSFCTKMSGDFRYANNSVKDFCGSGGTVWQNYSMFGTSGRNFTLRFVGS
jgi:uncharacterized membrane protein